MRPYSTDLRLRVLAAVDRGGRREDVAATFGVSVPTIDRYLRRRRETGDVRPKAITGPPARKGDALRGWLPERLGRHDDATLAEHCEAFATEAGVRVSAATMSRAVARLGWTRKKDPERQRAGPGRAGGLAHPDRGDRPAALRVPG